MYLNHNENVFSKYIRRQKRCSRIIKETKGEGAIEKETESEMNDDTRDEQKWATNMTMRERERERGSWVTREECLSGRVCDFWGGWGGEYVCLTELYYYHIMRMWTNITKREKKRETKWRERTVAVLDPFFFIAPKKDFLFFSLSNPYQKNIRKSARFYKHKKKEGHTHSDDHTKRKHKLYFGFTLSAQCVINTWRIFYLSLYKQRTKCETPALRTTREISVERRDVSA